MISDCKILIYYDDYRRSEYDSNVQLTRARLTRQHQVFTEDESSKCIIITSSYTLNARHESSAQRVWRTDEKVSQATINEQFHQVDLTWSFSLKKCIETLIIDEAHFVKNEITSIACVVKWLETSFTILIIVTSLINHARDFSDLINLIQFREVWTEQTLTAIQITVDINSFDYDVEHDNLEVKRLQCTVKVYEKFVMHSDISSITAEHRIFQIWAQCLIRRTYSSRISFKIDRMIDSTISSVQTITLKSAFTFDEQQVYESLYEASIKRIARKLINDKMIWNMKIFRKMILEVIWLGFEHCAKIMNFKHTVTLLKNSTTIWKLMKLCNAIDSQRYFVI